MDITKDNFREFLPMVKDAIEESHFISIDTELTGLSTQVTEHSFDTMPERYSKLRENCSKFLIIQFGVSTFQYNSKQRKYTHKDFNFYVFPRPHIRQAPDPTFMCQTSSLHFLASHQFDFNKLIHQGIPYLTPIQEDKIKDYLKNKHEMEKLDLASESDTQKTNGQKSVNVPDDHKDYIAGIIKRVDSFITNDSETVIQLDPCSSFRRKLIYQIVQRKYPTGIDMSSSTNQQNETSITILKASDEERFEKLELKQTREMDDLDSAIGFRTVLEMISQSKKLVIGHNMLLDVIHTVNQFFGPIPETLEEFKELLKCMFPRLLDTKNMASSEKFKEFFTSTSLFEVLKQVQGKAFSFPTVVPADGFKGYSMSEEKLHVAGYDAFITGLCFIGLSTKLGSMQSPAMESVSPSSSVLSPYVNRLFVMRHFDIPCLNLNGLDPEPRRDNVFHVTFPRQWRTVDLVELFSPYGNIYVNWIDDVSALVALKNPSQVMNAKTALVRNASSLFCVKTFADYQMMTRRNENPALQGTKPHECSLVDSVQPSRKRASGGTDAGSSRHIDPIPEDAENEAERADDPVSTSHEGNSISVRKSQASSSGGPRSKKQKFHPDENETGEVTSTARVFDEENVW